MKLSRYLALLSLFLCFIGTARADALDQFVRETMLKRKIPGLSIAVIRGGKVLRASGYGYANLELKVPAGPETVYEIGSISKQFAAEAVMLLVEEDKLDLDVSIRKYLPANSPEIWQRITVRNLLNHTSGLKDWTEIKEFSYRREYAHEEFIDLVRGFPLQSEPSDTWRYSNTNLPLVQIIVERVSGRTFQELVTDRIIKPLNLASIRFKHQEDVVVDRASGYVLRNGMWKNGEPFRPKVIAASGGILASAVDLAKWWEAVLHGRVVKAASMEQMLRPTRLSNGRAVAHGFAFFIDSFNGHKMIQHFGSTVGGFGSIVRYYPKEDVTVAVIGNLEDGGFGAEYIAKRVASVYISGAFGDSMKPARDLSPNQTNRDLKILKDISGGKTPEGLAASYGPKISDAFRKQLAENLGWMKSFAFLGSEKITADHFMLDPTLTEIFHYRMTLTDKNVYYHFRLDSTQKIGWIVFEE